MPTYPYTSGQAAVVQTFTQLRRGFPAKVDAGYLQRFGIAPANESYIIAILRFLGLIDEDGGRRDENTDFFFGGDDVFAPGLEKRLRDSYSQLFDEMGEDALRADRGMLTNWFRASDKTSALVGQRQASTFQTLSALAGYGDVPAARTSGSAKRTKISDDTSEKPPKAKNSPTPRKRTASAVSGEQPARTTSIGETEKSEVGLTVRIEVNLPSGGDADTYDAIFASIRKHLMS